MNTPTPPVRRRFLDLPARRVHYRRAGSGPPAVLIHPSPADSRLLMKEIARLAPDHTVFAFDTPGFGLSQPLPMATMEVADLADAVAETLVAIGMPPCPVFGSHTGASIALELGVRHPERVTGLVLDGVAAFTDEECDRYFGDYFRKVPVSDLGGHYAETWTRFRDQSIWFPWSERETRYLNPNDLSPPHSTHLWVSMYFDAADGYEPAYRAASFHGARAIAAARALTLPAVFTATETDMLYPHLDRLPPLDAGQAIVPIGSSYQRKRDLVAASFARYGAAGAPPDDRDAIGSSATVARQFVDGSQGSLHLRWRGDRTSPPLLVIHDAPGSARQLSPMLDALGDAFFAVAPDLPGHGESAAFAETPDVPAFADEMLALLDRLDLATVAIIGVGFGSSVAVEMARIAPTRVSAVGIVGMMLADGDDRLELSRRLTPPIPIEADGAHWYRTWLMLRDWQIYWPWFDRRRDALRRVEADFSAAHLHRWTMDVMGARDSYAHLIQAALAYDGAAMLRDLVVPAFGVSDRTRPLNLYDDALAAVLGDAPLIDLADIAALTVALGGRPERADLL